MALRNFLHQISPKYNLFTSTFRNPQRGVHHLVHHFYVGIGNIDFPYKESLRKMSENKLPVIEFETLKDQLSNLDCTLIDVREPKELKEDGTIPQSINIPLGQIVDAFKMSEGEFQLKYGILKPGTDLVMPLVLSCKSGKRATDAYQKLTALGYKNMSVYSGSFQDWLKNGGPVAK